MFYFSRPEPGGPRARVVPSSGRARPGAGGRDLHRGHGPTRVGRGRVRLLQPVG